MTPRPRPYPNSSHSPSLSLSPGIDMVKTLDAKLARILADPACGDFILADAKDGDMAYGARGLGLRPDGGVRSLEDYREEMRRNLDQGLIDILLMSVSSCEALAIREARFRSSPVTPAVRANDTTDIHLARGGVYPRLPSRPFRTATLDHAMYGRLLRDGERAGAPLLGADLGLYSITFNNDLERDLEALERYRDFRVEAELCGFRHFLELFDPNACGDRCPRETGRYLNDMVARTLAGVAGPGRPIFLKVPFHGPEAMEELAAYDRALVPGILGGAAGTTYDAFEQLHLARKHGARVALYGRMINQAEDQRALIQHLRWIADGQLTDPAEGVRSYHGELARRGLRPTRSLEEDLKSTRRAGAYAGSASVLVGAQAKAALDAAPAAGPAGSPAPSVPASPAPAPRVDALARFRERWGRVLG